MSQWIYLLLVPAGVLAGITGSVAGLASLVSYPALLAMGLPPVTANVSNTVALVFGGIGSVSASRVELAGRTRRTVPLAAATVSGGIIGGMLLMVAPAASFTYVVPWLVAGASSAVLLPRRVRPRTPHRWRRPVLYAGTTLIGVYGGYFGAASGVLLLALMLAMTDDTLPEIGASRNLLLGLANAVASVVFVIYGSVAWIAAAPLAIGFLIGGRVGPAITRRVSARPLQLMIAAAGFGLALDLAWQAYR